LVTLAEHTGGVSGGGGACQATVMLAGALAPLALLATTVYVTSPAVGELAVQATVVLAQLVHE
jgi:hypothetical protein